MRGCLQSIIGVVDEIVVVDTGSTDDTIAIVQSFGLKVRQLTWADDFATARNYGLAAATSDWILYIDADERLHIVGPEVLRAGLDDPLVFVARPRFRPTVGGTDCRELRLFRNDPRLRFRGSMHETIVPDLERLQRDIGARIIDSDARIVHLGYEGDLTAKHLRNIPLLRRAMEENPERLYNWHQLSEALAAIGKTDEALGVAQEGLSKARGQAAGNPMAAQLAWTAARLLRDRGEDALPVIEYGLSVVPGHRSLQFLLAHALVDRADYARALEIIGELTAIEPESYCDPLLSYDRNIFGAYAHDLAGLALLRMGKKLEASEAFSHAARAAPDDPSYRVKALALGAAPF